MFWIFRFTDTILKDNIVSTNIERLTNTMLTNFWK